MVISMIAYLRKNLFNNLSTRQTLFKNSFWRFMGVVPNKIVRFFIVLLAARQLSPNLFGTYNYTLALVSMAFIVSDWGINLLFIRDYQQNKDKNKVASASFFARLFILLATLCVAVIILLVNKDSAIFLPGIVIALTLALGYLKELFLAVFLAVQKAEIETKIYLFDSLISAILFFAVFYFKASVLTFALFYFLVNILVTVVAWFYARKIVTIGINHLDFHFLKTLLKNGLPLSLFGIVGYIFFSTDQLFLKHFNGYESVGYYALATKLILAVQIFPSLINTVLLPVLSKNINEKKVVKKIVFQGLSFYGIAGVIISVCIFFATPFFISFFGDKYLASTHIIQYLSPILIFMFMTALLDHVLVAYNLQKQDFYITLLAAASNVVLLCFFVPTLGIMGAVWSNLISQFLNFVLTFALTLRVLRKTDDLKHV